MGNRYLVHVGGAGRLMELQGPNNYQDPFAKEVLRFIRGGIVSCFTLLGDIVFVAQATLRHGSISVVLIMATHRC
jgi:hypothetical protein